LRFPVLCYDETEALEIEIFSGEEDNYQLFIISFGDKE